MKPLDVRIFLKPGKLLAHVSSGVRLNLSDSFLKRNLMVKILEHFLKSNGIEGVEFFKRIYFLGFGFKALVYHIQHSLIDAGVKFFTLSVQSYLTYSEWTLLDRKSTRLNSSHANISYAVFCLRERVGGADLVVAGGLEGQGA